jgi:hypothetical protein
MGQESSTQVIHWHSSKDSLDLHPSSKAFDPRIAGLISKTYNKYYDENSVPIHINNLGKSSLTLKALKRHPKTYALIKKLYEMKLAYASYSDQYSNTIDLDTDNYGVDIYYRMPPEYTELEDIFAKEFEEIQVERKKIYDEIEKKKKEEEERKKKEAAEKEEKEKYKKKGDAKILMDLVSGVSVANSKPEGQIDGKTDSKTDSKTDGKTDGKTDCKTDCKTDGQTDGKFEELSFVAVGTFSADPTTPTSMTTTLIPLDIDSVVNNINSVLRRRH